MAREYKLRHAPGQTWGVTGLAAKVLEAETVTAIDKRDVQPLVEAARDFARPMSPAEVLDQTDAEIAAKYDALKAALATFEESGE